MSNRGIYSTGGARKRFRKGTRSCFECRRRKLKCSRNHEKYETCGECLARGLNCITQEAAPSNLVVDKRKTLKTRVAAVEAFLEHIDSAHSTQGHFRSPLPSTGPVGISRDSHGSPIETPHMLYVQQKRIGGSHRQTQPNVYSDEEIHINLPDSPISQPDNIFHPNRASYMANSVLSTVQVRNRHKAPSTTKDRSNFQELRDALPPLSAINDIIDEVTQTHPIIRNFAVGFYGEAWTKESVAHALRDDAGVCEIAAIVQFIAASTNGPMFDHLVSIIDRLVIWNDEYIHTLEGIRCAYTQCHLYTDDGQARKAWQVLRHAASAAMALGLHRLRKSNREDVLWIQLYQSDRFLSIMLGLPYSIVQSHCNMVFGGKNVLLDTTVNSLTARIAFIAGQVIDYAQQTRSATDSTSVLLIDQKLEECLTASNTDFRQLSPTAPKDQSLAQVWVLQTFGQLMYYLVKAILHASHILHIAPNALSPQDEYIRDQCFKGARGILYVYYRIRSPSNITLCKNMAVDYVATIAAALLLLRLGGYGGDSKDLQQDEADWNLIDITIDTFRRMATDLGSKVAVQGQAVLKELTRFREHQTGREMNTQVFIPFFGTISVVQTRSVQNYQQSERKSTSSYSHNTAPTSKPAEENIESSNSHHSKLPTTATVAHKDDSQVYQLSYSLPHQSSEDICGDWIVGGMDTDLDWNWTIPSS